MNIIARELLRKQRGCMEEDKTWFAITPTLNLDPLLKNEIKSN